MLQKTAPTTYEYQLKHSFYFFCRECNRIYGRTHSKFHDRIITAMVQALWLVLLLFRGAAKTMYACYYALWLAWTVPNSYTVYLSGNKDQVRDGLRKIRHMATTLPFLKKDLNYALKLEVEFNNGSLIIGKTYGSNIRGMGNEIRRPNLIIGDDVIPDVPKMTHAQIIDVWVNGVIPALEIENNQFAKLFLIGTPFTEDDVYAISEKDDRYTFMRIGIEDEQGHSNWVERFSDELIARMKRNTDALTWAKNYMCLPIHPGGMDFKAEWILPYEDIDIPIDRNTIAYVWCDAALSESRKADYAGISLWIHYADKWWLIDAWAERGMDAMIDRLLKLEADPIITPKGQIKVAITRVEAPGAIHITLNREPKYQRLRTKTEKNSVVGNKVERIGTMEPKWKSGRFYAKKMSDGRPKNAPFFWKEYLGMNRKSPPKDLHILDGCQMGFEQYDQNSGVVLVGATSEGHAQW